MSKTAKSTKLAKPVESVKLTKSAKSTAKTARSSVLAGISFAVLCTVFTSLGQFFQKKAAITITLSFLGIITNIYLILGFLFYAIGMILFLLSLRTVGLSTAHPILSLGFVWVALLSIWQLGEVLLPIQWLGIFSIIAGVVLIGRSAS
ncbi:EamA family transporter [Candidatus Woesearchaeota archaeon]|nr:EamA family transporter [Candidatus Woesearchaeota archaeon]